jgi:OHCU decarboxylase
VARAGAERQVALIRAHPDLVGRAALAGTLTRESTGEQQAAGLDPGRLTPEEIAQFRELNEAYKTRFGFPFVICARENTKEAILSAFASRLRNNRDDEIATAIAEIAQICWYRLADAVDE